MLPKRCQKFLGRGRSMGIGIILLDFSIGLTVRRFICIFLLLLLPLHGFAMQGGWSPLENAFDLAHEAEHLEGTSHHHMDDGSIHYDDSGESAQHHAEHAASCHAVALPSTFTPQIALLALPFARSELRQYIPEHVLDRPQRPPQALG